MKQIEYLSVEADPNSSARLQGMLDEFTRKYNCQVLLHLVGWDAIWRELVNTSIYRRGSDVSEVGTTWLDSLAAMDTLRLFSPENIKALGGSGAFLPATWQSIARRGAAEVEAIPFRADMRVIYYWKDMVEAAGLDPAQVFHTPQGMAAELQALQQVIPTPWAVATAANNRNTLFYLASWIWEQGGDFLTPEHKEVAFDSPQALEGMRLYYELARFLPRTDTPISDDEVNDLFLQRKVAAVMSGPWLLNLAYNQNWSAERFSQMGITSPPGPSFVGGTCLVVWKHSRQQDYALKLVEYLTTPAIQAEYCAMIGFLPARRDAWDQAPFSSNPHYQALHQVLLNGRGLPPISLWGVIEERLSLALGQIWSELSANPAADLPALLRQHLVPLARRLNITLTG